MISYIRNIVSSCFSLSIAIIKKIFDIIANILLIICVDFFVLDIWTSFSLWELYLRILFYYLFSFFCYLKPINILFIIDYFLSIDHIKYVFCIRTWIWILRRIKIIWFWLFCYIMLNYSLIELIFLSTFYQLLCLNSDNSSAPKI